MRQTMSTPDVNSTFSIIDSCAVLMLDEVHSGSPDMELILARNGILIGFQERICICNKRFSAEIPTDLSL